jgi:alpha-L-fucosidase
VQYNIGEYGELTNDYACGNASLPLPPATAFDAPDLNATAWMEAVRSYGGKYAVLTVQAGCGFDLWPSNVSLPASAGGGVYNYTVRESKFGRDVLREFVDAARAAGIRPGIYYIVNSNVFMQRALNATVRRAAPRHATPCAQGSWRQRAAQVAEQEAVILGQLEEIWGSYGDLVELWFDGGTVDKALAPKLTALLKRLQPKAVCFQGPTATQGLRWAGTESGHATLPNWSTAKSSVDFGSGEPDAPVWAPTEADVTLSTNGAWYWSPGQPIKSLAYLASLYEASVGHNANLLLDFAPVI